MILKTFLTIIILFNAFALFSQHIENIYSWLDSNTKYETIKSRFPTPEGFKRIPVDSYSYSDWLRNLPVLPKGESVKDYKGKIRTMSNDTTLASIVAYNIKGKKLEQCMDIIIRWRAEYLYSNNLTDEILFNLPGNFLLKWLDWKNGWRPIYSGININLAKTENPDSSRKCFEKYLWEVFYYSYTQTAYFAYAKIESHHVQIGDFIVKKGKKGHAVLIVDLAEDKTGNKIALIGHGDTPARQFYILNYKKDIPWFPLNFTTQPLQLPFKKKMYWHGLRRF